MQRYEVARITVPLGGVAPACARIEEYLAGAAVGGRLLGCWTSEIGALNRILVLRGFEDAAALDQERSRMILAGNAFGVGEIASELVLENYAPFPFLPPVQPGSLGPFYEMRTYGIKPSGVQATIDAWRDAMPRRGELSPLTIAMYALDGVTPRFLNIWPYPSLDARSRARADAVAQGVWPPKGGPANLTTLHSEFYLPAPFSPLK